MFELVINPFGYLRITPSFANMPPPCCMVWAGAWMMRPNCCSPCAESTTWR